MGRTYFKKEKTNKLKEFAKKFDADYFEENEEKSGHDIAVWNCEGGNLAIALCSDGDILIGYIDPECDNFSEDGYSTTTYFNYKSTKITETLCELEWLIDILKTIQKEWGKFKVPKK